MSGRRAKELRRLIRWARAASAGPAWTSELLRQEQRHPTVITPSLMRWWRRALRGLA